MGLFAESEPDWKLGGAWCIIFRALVSVQCLFLGVGLY